MAAAKACSQAGETARIGTKPPSAVQAVLIWRASRARTCSMISSDALRTPRASAIAFEDARPGRGSRCARQQALQHTLDPPW